MFDANLKKINTSNMQVEQTSEEVGRKNKAKVKLQSLQALCGQQSAR